MKTRPWLGSRRICPVRHLKKVLLPAPFGPIRQRSSRSRSEKLTLLTACTPPKRIDRSRVSSTVSLTDVPRPVERRPGARPASLSRVTPLAAAPPRAARLAAADPGDVAALAPARQRREQAARQQQHDQHEDRAEHQRVVDQGL